MFQEINYIKHMNGILLQFSMDNRLNPTHISLYIALFQLWNSSYFQKEFYINREEVMQYSKIGSKSTYHRCIKELSHWNYILYCPSHNPFKGSKIKMFDFGTSNEQAIDPDHNKNRTSVGQALVSNSKHDQTRKNLKNSNQPQNFDKSTVQHSKTKEKPTTNVSYQDNLKTSSNKNYDEPL